MRRFIVAWMLMLFALSACGAPAASPTHTPLVPTQPPTETAAPSPTVEATATSTPMLVAVFTQTVQASGQSPTYTLTANIPQVAGEDDFNTLAAALVNDEITLFRDSVLMMPPVPDGYGSSLDIGYDVTSAAPQAFSLLIGITGYVDGAAHPYHYARVINYDFELDRPLALVDLFTPGADYLRRLAEYCIAELQTREFVDNLSGAAPTEENYALWNITPDGLLITFNEYQVAPYAAGAQTVTVPYDILRDILAPERMINDK